LINRIMNIRNKWILSGLAGVLMGLSFSPFPFPFLLFAAFILLFRLSHLSNGFRDAAYHSYPAFLVWNIIGTYWLTMATVVGGTAAILANSAIMAVVFGLMHLIVKRFSSVWLAGILSSGVWVTYEWLHLKWDLAWPWLILANAWSTHTWAVQYIEFTGFLSVSFLTITVSYFLYDGILNASKSVNAKTSFWQTKSFISGTSIWFFSALLSLVMLWNLDLETDETVHVVIAQPNYDSYLPIAGYNDTTTPLLELTAMMDSVVTDQTQIMFWPENALMGGVDQLFKSYNDRHLLSKAAEWGIPVVTGAPFFMYYEDEEAPRVHRTDREGRAFNYFNSAVAYYPDGSMNFYNKIRLVPIVERMPFAHALSRTPLPVNWGEVTGFGRGTEMILFDSTNGPSSPAVVCYDSVFPDVVRRSVVKNAGFITVITNDGWWGNTSGHIQHYEFARLRAIETRRAVVRSANNGISGMITADGRPHTKTEYWTRTAFELEVPVYEHKTFYVRHGDWFNFLMLFMALTGLSGVFLKRKQ